MKNYNMNEINENTNNIRKMIDEMNKMVDETNKKIQELFYGVTTTKQDSTYTKSEMQEYKDKLEKRSKTIIRLMRNNALYEKAYKNEDAIADYLMKDSDFQERNGLESDDYLNELHVSYWLSCLALAIESNDWEMVADLIRGEYDFINACDYCGKNDPFSGEALQMRENLSSDEGQSDSMRHHSETLLWHQNQACPYKSIR